MGRQKQGLSMMPEGKSIGSTVTSDEEYATMGPLTMIFDNPTARLLDQSMIVGKMEQTISMLMESTNLSYKTVEKNVKRLIDLNFMRESRKIGNAMTYSFNVENHLSDLIQCAQKWQMDRLKKEVRTE